MTGRTAKNTLAVSLLAGLAGAGFALLVAPRSGKETRERLKARAGDMKAQADEKLDHGREKASELKDRLQDAVSGVEKKVGRKLEKRGEDMETNKSDRSPVLTAWKEEV